LLIVLVCVIACKKENPIDPKIQDPKTFYFTVNIEGQDTIKYFNPECEFDNRHSQSQFNSSTSIGYELFSTYENKIKDSLINQIWFDLNVVAEPIQVLYDVNYLTKIIGKENNSFNNKHLKLRVQIEINGSRYDNRLLDMDTSTPPWEVDDSLYYEIKDYDLFYHSQCLNRDLIYLKIEMAGKLYQYDFYTKIDSITINKTVMNLLFSRD